MLSLFRVKHIGLTVTAFIGVTITSTPDATGESVGREGRMIEGMEQVHMSEAEVVKDIQAVLEKVRQGAEVIVEQGDRTVAIIKPSDR